MVEAIYLDNMFDSEFKASVQSIDEGKYVVLDRTAFYPNSGGVAHDTGTLRRDRDGEAFRVVFTGKFGGTISHEVDRPGLEAGDRVTGALDWERRYTLMRYHTAAHVISGTFWKEGGVKISGNQLDVDGGRMDFTLEDFDKGKIEGFVQRANEVVEADLPVDVYYIDREKLNDDPDLVKLAAGFPKDIERIRIVDIRGFDRQPDGGCHVRSTGEIGRIELTKTKNKGKNNRRMYFSLG
ncbi:MAG: alanyl-tRNA editing protein [Methanomassiliicoccales archaeon]